MNRIVSYILDKMDQVKMDLLSQKAELCNIHGGKMIYHLYKKNIRPCKQKTSCLLSALLLLSITLTGCKTPQNVDPSAGNEALGGSSSINSSSSGDASSITNIESTSEASDNTTVLNNGNPIDGPVLSEGSFDGSDYVRESVLTGDTSVSQNANAYPSLSVPTDITYLDGRYFIVDCYHSQIIYNDNLSDPLTDWTVLTDNASSGYSLGHTIVSDGSVMLADDTENNRVLVFERSGDGYTLTQTFDEIGNKPHYIVYNEGTNAFYCWSSYSGEMYIFRHKKDDTRMYLTNVVTIERLADTYVRSFTIDDNDLYFVSGLPADGSSSFLPQILKYDLISFDRIESYDVPEEIAGMVQLEHIGDLFYITVSTDLYGSQDAATMICASSIEDISSGNYETVYDDFFEGGGTPYYMGVIDGTWYLTEHRLPAHAIWSFNIDESGAITASDTIY